MKLTTLLAQGYLVPIITGEPIQAFAAGPQFMGIAYLPTVSVGHVSQLHGTIDWGDGTTSTGTLTGGDLAKGNWQVSGTHTYKYAGTYKTHAVVYSHVIGFKGPGFPAQDFFTLIHVVK